MLTLYTCLKKENISKMLHKPEYKHKESTTIPALSITVVLMKQNKAEKVCFVMSVTSANNNFKVLMNN